MIGTVEKREIRGGGKKVRGKCVVISGCPGGISEKVGCEHKLTGSRRVSQTNILGKSIADRGNSLSKSPEAGVCQKVQGRTRLPGGWNGRATGSVT